MSELLITRGYKKWGKNSLILLIKKWVPREFQT